MKQSLGWVKIHRMLTDKGWYLKSEYVHLWIHLLISANHKDKEFWFNGQNILVKSGQLVTGRKQLSKDTGINEGKIERILKCFENEQQIEQQTNNRNRLISILNYKQYQENEQPTNNKCTTSVQQVYTNKNDKNVKERKEVFINNVNEFIDKYNASMISDFISYWTELNKSGKKMRFESQDFFDISRRLATWNKNNFNNNKNEQHDWQKYGITEKQYIQLKAVYNNDWRKHLDEVKF